METKCVDMVNVNLNGPEIGTVLLFESNHEIQIGTNSGDCFGQWVDDKFELIVFGAGTDQGHDDLD